jgi:serine/threonine protein kinase
MDSDEIAIEPLRVSGNIVLDKLGEGGMGAVFRARHRRMKRVVAIKVLPQERVNSPERLERFQHEIETVALDQIVAAIEAGAQEYIMKPFTEEILLDRLRQAGLLE